MGILRFLNLVDYEGNFSITNASVIVSLILNAVVPGIAPIVSLGLSTLNYMHKRSVNADAIQDSIKRSDNDDVKQRLDYLELSRKSAMEKINHLESVHAQVAKQSDEVRTTLQAASLSGMANLPRTIPRMK